jgi:hypothetical protein
LENLPTLHGTQDGKPNSEYVPLEQSIQANPGFELLPARQNSHTDDPEIENFPLGQV